MHSARCRSIFRRVLKFLQIKDGGPNFWGKPSLKKVWIIWFPLLYFNFKSLIETIFASFIRFQCTLQDSGVLFAESWNFYKLKMRDLISWANQLCRKSQLFGPPFCISILKVWWMQFLPSSLDSNAFCMIQEYFLQSL